MSHLQTYGLASVIFLVSRHPEAVLSLRYSNFMRLWNSPRYQMPDARRPATSVVPTQTTDCKQGPAGTQVLLKWKMRACDVFRRYAPAAEPAARREVMWRRRLRRALPKVSAKALPISTLGPCKQKKTLACHMMEACNNPCLGVAGMRHTGNPCYAFLQNYRSHWLAHPLGSTTARKRVVWWQASLTEQARRFRDVSRSEENQKL